MITKESGSGLLQNEKEKLLLAPYSDGEDSEIEIGRKYDGYQSIQVQLAQINKKQD